MFPAGAHSRISHCFKGELSCASRQVRAQRANKQNCIGSEPASSSLPLSSIAHDVPTGGQARTEAGAQTSLCEGPSLLSPPQEAKTLLNWMQVGDVRRSKHLPHIPPDSHEPLVFPWKATPGCGRYENEDYVRL